MLTADQPPFTVDCVAVRHLTGLAEHLDRPSGSPPVHAVVRDVAEDQPFLVGMPNRPLQKAKSGRQPLQRSVPDNIDEAWVPDLHGPGPHLRAVSTRLQQAYQSGIIRTPAFGSAAISEMASVERHAIPFLRLREWPSRIPVSIKATRHLPGRLLWSIDVRCGHFLTRGVH